MPVNPQIDTSSVIGPALETAERIKGARTRRSLAEMALKYGPAREDRQRRSQELDIQAKERGMEVGEEELEYKRRQRMLTAGLKSLPLVQDLDQYFQWKDWMIGQGANENEIPIPVEGMDAKDFPKFKKEVTIAASKMAAQYGLEEYRATNQMKVDAARTANQIRIYDKRLEVELADQKKAGKETLKAGEIDAIYEDEYIKVMSELGLIVYDKETGRPTGYKRSLSESEKKQVSERARERILRAERDEESWEDYVE